MKSLIFFVYELAIAFLFLSIISCSSDTPDIVEPEGETPVEKIVLKKVEVVDGTIYLTWNPIKKTNFDKATLIVADENSVIHIDLSKEIISSQKFNDTLSVGRKLEYKIKLENEISQSISNSEFLYTDEITITEKLIGFNKLRVVYTKHPIYKNFDYYDYTLNYYRRNELSPLGGEFIVDYRFIFANIWTPNVYHHEFHLRHYNSNYGINRTKKSFKIGTVFEKKNCKEYVYDKVKNVFYGVELIGSNTYNSPREVYIHKLNPTDFSTFSSTYIATVYNEYASITVDPFTNNLILDLYYDSYLLNSEDFSIIKHFEGNDYIPNLYYSNTHYRNGMIIIEEIGRKVSIFNTATNELLYSEQSYHYFNISDDGKYFYNNDKIYKIIGNEVSFVVSTDIKPAGRYLNSIDFILSENKCAYTAPDHYPVIFDFTTNIKTIINDIYDADFVDYDENKNEYLFAQYHVHDDNYDEYRDVSFINLYKFDNLLNRKIEVYDSHNSHFYRYINGRIIFSGGQYLDDSYLGYE